MADYESKLTIKVDSTSANKASDSLDKLTGASKRAEGATKKLNETSEQAKKRIHDMVQASGKQQRATANIEKSDRALREEVGKVSRATQKQTRATEALYNAQSRSMASAKRYIEREKDVRKATTRTTKSTHATTKAFAGSSKTARELQFAMRGLPAQFTDIGVSLASGQRPLMVFLQQGGQLKDMFGGIKPALSAVGQGLRKIINPYTVAAAVAGSLAIAWYQGQREAVEYNIALAKTGDYAGVTASQLGAMAAQLDNVAGVTEHAAAGVIAMITSTGKFHGEAIPMVAKAALQMQKLGTKTSETVETFERLGKDPVDELLKLNKTMHFLTGATVQQVQALMDQGREQQAAAVAQRAYADAVDKATHDVHENLGLLQKAWGGVTQAASEAWDAMLDIGRPEKIEQKIGGITAKIEAAQKRIQELQQGPATRRVRHGREWTTISSAGVVKSLQDQIDGMKKQRNTLQRQIINTATGKGTFWKKATDGIEADAASDILFFGKVKTRKQKEAAELEKVNMRYQRALLFGGLSKEGKAKLAREHALKVKRIKESYATDVASAGAGSTKTGKSDNFIDDVFGTASGQIGQLGEKWIKGQQAAAAYKATLQDMLATRKRQIDLQVRSSSMSQLEIQHQRQLIQVDREYNRKLARLKRQQRDSGSSIQQQWYAQQIADLQSYHDARIALEKDGFQRAQAARHSAQNGFVSALAQIRDDGMDKASMMATATTRGFNDLTDAVVNFATTGEFSLKSFATNFAKMMVRMETSALAAKAATAILGMFTGTSSGGTQSSWGSTLHNNWSSVTASANGNVFTGPGIAAYENQIVSKPTHFYANGGNVMGEAGPEGIMPLKRMSNGKLGVYAMGGSEGDIIINTTVNVEEGTATSETDTKTNNRAARQLAGMMEATAKQVVVRATQPGGILWKQRNGVPA